MIDTTTSQSTPKVLELERVFKAPPERVFDAFASGGALKQWFGPGECGVVGAEIDFRVGGHYRLRMTTEKSGEIDLVGIYEVVDRPGRLRFTWRWEDNRAFNPCDSVVDIQFVEHAEGTLLKLRQAGIENDEDRASHDYGWNGAFDKLVRLFS